MTQVDSYGVSHGDESRCPFHYIQNFRYDTQRMGLIFISPIIYN